jgi:hypothetical protein
MAKAQRPPRKPSDPNQLSLLDYVPAEARRVEFTAKPKPQRARLRKSAQQQSPANTVSVLTAHQAANYLNLSLATLKSWRAKKIGPAFVKRGARLIGYRLIDLDAFLDVKNAR